MNSKPETAELDIALPAPKVDARDVQRVIEILDAGGNWMTANEIADCFDHENGRERPGVDRLIRAIANSAAPRIVSYPGSPGYKLIELCTIEELERCLSALEHQATQMLKRSILYRQNYHRRFGRKNAA